MTWLPQRADGDGEFDRVLGLCPEIRSDLEQFTNLFDTGDRVDPEILALCRALIDRILGATAGSAEIATERLAALDDWRASPAFTDRARACLAFAEQFVLDPHAITDADAAAVTRHLTPPEMVAFVEALAIADGFTRFRVILGIGGLKEFGQD